MALPGSGLIRFARWASPPAGAPSSADVVAALPSPVVVIDTVGNIVEANAAAETLLNLSQSAMMGRPFETVIGLGGEGRPASVTITGDAPFAAYDIELQPPVSGRRFRADMMVAPCPDHPGWRVATIHNRAGSHIASRRGERHGVMTAVGAAAMLAHEIKNPLSGIRGAAQLLEGSVDAGSGELTRLIRDEVDRIAALIDRMEGFTDTRPLEVSPQNIHAILGHARDVARRGFARDIPIREIYDPSLPAFLGHRDAMVQIVLNLLKNACEVMGDMPGAAITLTTSYRHGVSVPFGASDGRRALPIEVCVIDEGPGAPPSLAEHLFEPFVTSKQSGGGLGLALVDKLVGDQGGIIEYAREGVPAKTVFRILLPRAGGRL